MGNLLKVLTCTDLEQEPNFFLDFENAQPTDAEREVWEEVDVVLKDAAAILDELQAYKGAGREIREAIQNPSDEGLQDEAWAAVVPLVGRLKKFYEFSQRLEAALHRLLRALTSESYNDPMQHLEREQALAKQFAEILHFTLRFDELKMTNPAIQNDFSYYRRTLNRMRINNVPAEGENEVNNELANRISLFYADATPMLKTLSDGTTKFVSENKNLPIENTTDVLSTMASVCKVMLENPDYRCRFSSEETVSFCLRVMVGVIILYDYVHPVGAFSKSSKIDVSRVEMSTFRFKSSNHNAKFFSCLLQMKGCIKVLKDQPPNTVDGLLNALRYIRGASLPSHHTSHTRVQLFVYTMVSIASRHLCLAPNVGEISRTHQSLPSLSVEFSRGLSPAADAPCLAPVPLFPGLFNTSAKAKMMMLPTTAML
uniref:CYRIA/CYRIB Rac1 binding domain-containing protein n=1 Tax=Denticeps clupeoides TaxID=299321 RepID=A0AAY4BNB0_9TELE